MLQISYWKLCLLIIGSTVDLFQMLVEKTLLLQLKKIKRKQQLKIKLLKLRTIPYYDCDMQRNNNLKDHKKKCIRKNPKYFSTLWGKLEVFEWGFHIIHFILIQRTKWRTRRTTIETIQLHSILQCWYVILSCHLKRVCIGKISLF